MIKITALNESESEEEATDETVVTDEAQETIAENEYMRALKYKGAGKPDLALSLMLELLETRVLNEVCMESHNEKLLAIRYNCHKNIALIYEETKEYQKSLDHFMQAIHIDDTDVYTMHRLGQLALRLHVLDIADYAFEKCLKRNPNHWSAADGILQVMCLNQNLMGAYGWALKWYLKDNKYERALDVLTEITENFPDLIEFYQTIWSTPFLKPEGRTCKGKKSVFPEPKDIPEQDTKMVKPDLEQFRVKTLDWLSIGRYIISVYNHLHETKQCILFILSVDDFLEISKDEDNEKLSRDTNISQEPGPRPVAAESNENSNEPSSNSNQSPASNSQPDECMSSGNDAAVFITPSTENIGSRTPQQNNDSNAEDSDTNNAKQDTETSNKPTQRRRCSDLRFLEQWGWHKNRRHTTRKKSQQDRPEVDTTLNGFLKRIFAKFTDEIFEDEWPFKSLGNDEKCHTSGGDGCKKQSSEKLSSFEEFQAETKDDFNKFLERMKSNPFDLILLIFRWLKYVSKYWDHFMGDDMKAAYHEIFTFYMNHYDLVAWNQLSNDNFNASYRMCMFFMELDLEKTVKSESEISSMWQRLFTHLTFNSGCAFVISDDLYERNIIRLIHMEYCWAKYENRLSQCVESLQHLEELIGEQSDDFSLELPNMNEWNYLNRETVIVIRSETQRKIGLNKVKDLYEQKQWKELILILKDSLINSKEVKDSEAWTRDLQTQFEVLLESIWQTADYDECLIWAEQCMQYAVSKYTAEPGETYRQRKWAENINYIFTYLEALTINEGYQILDCLEKYLPRLVQNVIKLLAYQLDAPFDKNNNLQHPLEIKRPWILLHQVLLREENNTPIVIKTRPTDVTMDTEEIEDLLPHSFLTLFTAHEFLGKRQWCTRDNGQLLLYTIEMIAPYLRAPLYDSCRDIVMEYMEQTTYCLYGYPPKKARSKHIEEHEATSVELTWPRAIQLFDLYRPENLPEFNSYKLESISTDMEQLLLKIVQLIPKEMDPTSVISNIHDFISGTRESLPDNCVLLPYRVSCIYYLLADYYFKSRDFSKTLKYYPLDLACHPDRFDSWAGMALSKASKIETKLNGFATIDIPAFLSECEDTIRCFKQCTKLNHEQVLVWIEYGSFAYTLHSFCSRDLKHSSDTLSLEQFTAVEDRKDNYLKIANDCFSKGDSMLQNQTEEENYDENESHDEKWLNQYMLGKIGEKRKEQPSAYMNHYLTAANYLYENNATYPIKINHSNPTTLSVEALEIFYRTNAAIIKFLEQDKQITREVGDLFNQVLNNLANSPFAFNKAKIDDNSLNAFKRKIADKVESNAIKQAKLDEAAAAVAAATAATENSNQLIISEVNEGVSFPPLVASPIAVAVPVIVEPEKEEESLLKPKIEPTESIDIVVTRAPSGNVTAATSKATSPSRRASQESSATNSSSTATGTTSSASSSSSSDSSSSDSDSSDSESSSSDDGKKRDKNTPYSDHELEAIYRSCVRNLEECVTRFPEHYKSVYRLVHHYLHAPDKLKDIEKCRQLLLGQYTTNLGNQINGLFSDRKNNNIFNGIWRIPSSEIDRPGSFSSHLVKCVSILIQVLRKSNNHKLLIDVALQLHRIPDSDKRYIKDSERTELFQQAMTFCVQIMRNILKQIMEIRDNVDVESLNLLIDIYKAHKKCIKHMNQKEPLFIQLLVDVYKFYIQDKVAKMPENLNHVDLAIKLCLQEISVRKNQEKQAMAVLAGVTPPITTAGPGIGAVECPPVGPKPSSVPPANVPTTTVSKTVQIPGITSRARGRPVGSKNTQPQVSTSSFQQPAVSSATIQAATNLINQTSFASLMSLYSNPSMTGHLTKDHAAFQKLVAEYYALLGGPTGSATALLPNLAAPSMNPIVNPLVALQPPKAPATPNNPELSPSSTTTTTTAKMPQFDIKNLIASAASQVSKTATSSHSHSTTINIGGGELTITPTCSKAVHTKEATASSSSKLSASMTSSSSSISVTKVPAHSPNIYVKPLADMTTKTLLPPKLPELPKSLSITPSTSLFPVEKSRPQKMPNMSLMPDLKMPNKMQGKAKSSSKKKPTPSTPYVRPPSAPPSNSGAALASLSSAELASLASINPQFPLMNNFSMENYNQQAAMLTQYADLLKTMGPSSSMMSQIAQMSQFQQFQMLGQKRPYAKRNRQPKPKKPPQQDIHAAVESALKSLSPQITMIPSSSKASKQPQQQTFSMPTYSSPATLTSVGPPPSISMSGPPPPPQGGRITPKPIHTPPPSITPGLQQTSPVKTLQQKLAERQKANQQMNENAQKPACGGNASSGVGKRGKVDVIILD